MLKLYSCSAASMMVLMVPLPDCTPPLILSLSISVSHASTGWLVITLMDEQTRREVVSFARASGGSVPHNAHMEPSNRLQSLTHHFPCDLWPDWGWRRQGNFLSSWEQMDAAALQTEPRVVFSPSWWTLLLYKGLVSCSIMDSWWLAITAHFQKPRPATFLFFFGGGVAYNWLFFQESVIYYFVKYWSSGKGISHWSPLCCFHARSKLRVCLWSKMVVMPWNDVWCNKHATGKVW